MDANKSESDKCIEIAKKFMHSNDYDKAIKFLNKALKLHPSNDDAKSLINQIETLKKKQQQQSSSSSSSTSNDTSQKQERNESSKTENSTQNVEYTSEQVEAVKRIKSCKDFYEILGVPKTANENDLKKSYKKLALQFHPDKNKAPGAESAFKLIGKAFSILSDTTKRKQYDMGGCNDLDDVSTSNGTNAYNRRQRSTSNTTYYSWSNGADDDFSAEELFNMFFGTNAFSNINANNRQAHRRQRHQNQQQQQQQYYYAENVNNYSFIQSLMPILLIVVLSLLSSFMVSEPLYSLHKTSKYTIKRHTHDHSVPYFVRQDFKLANDNEIKRLERQIEDELLTELRQNCYREKSYKETTIWRARTYGDERLIKRANDIETPSCDKINQIWNAGS